MKKVLIIEDDHGLAQLLNTILSLSGFQVEIAYTGKDGLAWLEKRMPDAIVLDMHLPGVSGSAIYDYLEQRGQAFRVVVCSADVQLVDQYKARGVNAVAKPIESIASFTAMVVRIANPVTVV